VGPDLGDRADRAFHPLAQPILDGAHVRVDQIDDGRDGIQHGSFPRHGGDIGQRPGLRHDVSKYSKIFEIGKRNR
jgi:hypothetical protein